MEFGGRFTEVLLSISIKMFWVEQQNSIESIEFIQKIDKVIQKTIDSIDSFLDHSYFLNLLQYQKILYKGFNFYFEFKLFI